MTCVELILLAELLGIAIMGTLVVFGIFCGFFHLFFKITEPGNKKVEDIR